VNQGVKIGIAVVALIAAGAMLFLFSGRKEQSMANADETKTLWMCTSCNEPVDITAGQIQQLAKDSGGPAPPYLCSKCKEKKLFRAMKCDKCGSAYFPSGVPDSTGVCKQCNPDAKPLPPPTDEVEEAAPTNEDGTPENTDTPVQRKVKKKRAA